MYNSIWPKKCIHVLYVLRKLNETFQRTRKHTGKPLTLLKLSGKTGPVSTSHLTTVWRKHLLIWKWSDGAFIQRDDAHRGMVFLVGVWFVSMSRMILSYCWWTKSCSTWNVCNPVNNRDEVPTSTGARFLPSTVALSIQTCQTTLNEQTCWKYV